MAAFLGVVAEPEFHVGNAPCGGAGVPFVAVEVGDAFQPRLRRFEIVHADRISDDEHSREFRVVCGEGIGQRRDRHGADHETPVCLFAAYRRLPETFCEIGRRGFLMDADRAHLRPQRHRNGLAIHIENSARWRFARMRGETPCDLTLTASRSRRNPHPGIHRGHADDDRFPLRERLGVPRVDPLECDHQLLSKPRKVRRRGNFPYHRFLRPMHRET